MQTIPQSLPEPDEMYAALLARDAGYEGIFVVGVRTTGIFCRPTCPARKPKLQNVEFFGAARDALSSGYQPCKRCRPLERGGEAPDWLRPLLERIESDPSHRWTDGELLASGLDPVRVRRWFKAQHGMTFHGYVRSRRLGRALSSIREGADLTATAHDAGYESPSGFREAFGQWFGATPGASRGREVLFVRRLLTPLGPMVTAATDEGVVLCEFADRRMLETQLRRLGQRLEVRPTPGTHAHLEQLETELSAWFAGALETFSVPLLLPGTAFQQAVWRQLRALPYGTTCSYAELARAVGRPGAERAVGRANGDNRIAILVPCHRVVRADGRLCGYGGGLWRKQALLEREGVVVVAGRVAPLSAADAGRRP